MSSSIDVKGNRGPAETARDAVLGLALFRVGEDRGGIAHLDEPASHEGDGVGTKKSGSHGRRCKLPQSLRSHRRLLHPRNDRDPLGVVPSDPFNLRQLAHHARAKQRIARSRRGEARVDDPREGLDAAPPQVAWSCAASDTGVVSASVTRIIFVYAGSCSRMSGVTTPARGRSATSRA